MREKWPHKETPAEKMNKVTKKLIHQSAKKPKMLFLLDGTGALLTVVLLLVILKNFGPCT